MTKAPPVDWPLQYKADLNYLSDVICATEQPTAKALFVTLFDKMMYKGKYFTSSRFKKYSKYFPPPETAFLLSINYSLFQAAGISPSN